VLRLADELADPEVDPDALAPVEVDDELDPDSEDVTDPVEDGGGVAVELTLLETLPVIDPERLVLGEIELEMDVEVEGGEQYRRTRFSPSEETKSENVVFVSNATPNGRLRLV